MREYPIQRTTLTQQVVQLIQRRILNGDLIMGDRLWARDLAAELDVSIVPVKEALLILMGEGLITNIPRRGSIIRRFTIKEIRELYDVRRLLELEALKIISKNGKIDDGFVGQLRDINEKLGQLRDNGEFTDRHEAYELDWKFHDTLMQVSGHDLLIEMYARLNMQAQIIRYASWDIGPRGDKTYEEHDAIIQALENQDTPMTTRAITKHLSSIVGDFFNKYQGQENSIEPATSQSCLPGGRRKSKKM